MSSKRFASHPFLPGSLLGGADLRWRDASPASAACEALLRRARHAAMRLDCQQRAPLRLWQCPEAGARRGGGVTCGWQEGGECSGGRVPLGSLVVFGGVAGHEWLTDVLLVSLWEGPGAPAGGAQCDSGTQRGCGSAQCAAAGGAAAGEVAGIWYSCEALEQVGDGPASARPACVCNAPTGGAATEELVSSDCPAILATTSIGNSTGASPASSGSGESVVPSAAVPAKAGTGERRDFAACAVGPDSFAVHGGFLGDGLEASDLFLCTLERTPASSGGGSGGTAGTEAASGEASPQEAARRREHSALSPAPCEGPPRAAWRARWERASGGCACDSSWPRSGGGGACGCGTPAPHGRSHHSLCCWGPGRCLVLFGGYRSGAGCLCDLWVWSMEHRCWWTPAATGADIRGGHE